MPYYLTTKGLRKALEMRTLIYSGIHIFLFSIIYYWCKVAEDPKERQGHVYIKVTIPGLLMSWQRKEQSPLNSLGIDICLSAYFRFGTRASSQYKDDFLRWDRLSFIMWIPILARRRLYTETAPKNRLILFIFNISGNLWFLPGASCCNTE